MNYVRSARLKRPYGWHISKQEKNRVNMCGHTSSEWRAFLVLYLVRKFATEPEHLWARSQKPVFAHFLELVQQISHLHNLLLWHLFRSILPRATMSYLENYQPKILNTFLVSTIQDRRGVFRFPGQCWKTRRWEESTENLSCEIRKTWT